MGTLDKFVAWEVWKHNQYGDLNFKENGVVIDIGGHIGTFTLFAANKLTKGRVITFEPFPDNYKMIRKNLTLNKIDNVILNQEAVGDKIGKRILHLDTENNGANSFYESDSNKIINVPTTTLEKIFKRYKLKEVELIKIDAEGAEYDILLSCRDSLLKKVKKIVLEYHDYLNTSLDHRQISKRLSSLGFVVKDRTPMIQKILMKSGILIAERNKI